MKGIRRSVAGMAAGITLCLATPSHAKHDDLAQIKAMEDALTRAVNARDLDAVMSAYLGGDGLFVFDVVPPRQFVGAAAFRADRKAFLAGPISYRTSDLVVETHGTVAFGHKILHAVGADGAGHAYDFTARVTDVYRKIDGKWLIVQEHASVPVDATTGTADLKSTP